MLKLIERQWNLPSLTSRDAAAMDPLDALDFISAPRFLIPPQFPKSQDRASAYQAPAIGAFEADNIRTFIVACFRSAVSTYGLRAAEAERATASAGPLTLVHGDASVLNMRTVHAAARHCLQNDDPVSWLSRDAAAAVP